MASPLIVTLTGQNFEQEVLKSPTPILVDFWASWCGPCKMIAPLLDELAEEYQGRVRIGKVDVDQESNLAAKYGVQAIPHAVALQKRRGDRADGGGQGQARDSGPDGPCLVVRTRLA